MQQQPFTPQAAAPTTAASAFGASPPASGGAQPPGGMTPDWRGLKSGFGTPVSEFVGTFNHWQVNQTNFGAQVQMDFVSCQVLASDSPYPRAEVTLEIKYSDSENSGWGVFGMAMARAMGVDINALNLDALRGIVFHMYRYNKDYGINQQTNQQMTGRVWNAVAMIPAGGAFDQITGGPREAEFIAPPAPVVAQPAVATTTPTAPAPVAQQPVAAPVVATAPVVPAAPIATDPTERALEILDGKNAADFFSNALPDEIIRAAPLVSQAIMNMTFVEGMIAAGRVTLDADGIHHVVPLTT